MNYTNEEFENEEWKCFYDSNASRWKHVNYRKYWWVSSLGRIKITYNYKDEVKWPKLYITGNNRHEGYYSISINQAPEKYVHRLVAKYFVANPDGMNVVDHINHDKHDNRASNLQWISHGENIKRGYAYRRELNGGV